MELLENTTLEMKNSLDGFNSHYRRKDEGT